jgi:uncharacterized membrane protein YidH (DUF202 family)
MHQQDSLVYHGLLMALAFGIFLPASALVSRYFKEQLDQTWVRLHVLLITIAMMAIGYGTYLVSPFQSEHGIDINDTHTLLGFLVLIIIAVQIGLGISCQLDHDPDLKEEETNRDIVHACLGIGLILIGSVTVVEGMLRRVRNDGVRRNSPISYYIAWMIAVIFFFALFEYYRGRTSRYSKGNIFAACSQFGAKRIFSISGKQRMGLIDSNVVDPNATMIGGVNSALRYKEGTLSPFLYRPTWDSGMKKPKNLQSLVPTEQFMQKKSEQKVQMTAKPLERMADQEDLPNIPRSRSNSIRNTVMPVLVPLQDKSKTHATHSISSARTRSATASILVETRSRRDSVIERLAEKLTQDFKQEHPPSAK